jgi:hypothetical protein
VVVSVVPSNDRFAAAIARFDDANRDDPNRTILDGVEHPDELLYAIRMTGWLGRMYPDASEALQLAVRCQHIRRWNIPRSRYPMDRAGYHRWRTELAKFHADTAATILREVGYDGATIARVQSLVRKENLKSDLQTQALEDVACLVFLEHEFSDFARKHDEAKVVNILQRTWKKMSPLGQRAALSLRLSEKDRRLIESALG